MNVFKKLETQRKLIDSLTKENDDLKTKLAFQDKNYTELKNTLRSVSCLSSEYEFCIDSLKKDIEEYQKLSQEMIRLKQDYEKQARKFANGLKIK